MITSSHRSIRRRCAHSTVSAALVLTASIALTLGAGPTPPAAAEPPASADWLGVVNWYRTTAGLAPVTNEASWSAGISAHLNYLRLTPASYRTGQYASAHTENPASPFYTAAGDAAGRASNLGGGATDRAAIEGWIRAPFHALGILNPLVTKMAFHRDPATNAAGLDVIRGIDWNRARPTTPVLFPGNGATVDMHQFSGGESPNPLETCGYTAPTGLPLIAALPTSPVAGMIAELTGPTGTVTSRTSDLCVVNQHTYRTSDTVYGETGRGLLTGSKAVFIIAKRPLNRGAHTVRLIQPGRADVRWTFSVSTNPLPPPRPPAGTVRKVKVGQANATVFGNLTVVSPAANGYTTAYPCAAGRPTASNNNYVAGRTVANFAAVRSDANGEICIYTSASAHLLWDQTAISTTLPAGTPVRKLNTRTGVRPAARSVTRINVATAGKARTALGNLTIVGAAGPGEAIVYPCADGRTATSNVSYPAGAATPAFAAVRTDTNGDICVYVTAAAHILWDHVATWDQPLMSPARRVLDSRNHFLVRANSSIIVGVAPRANAVVFGTLTVVAPSRAGYVTAHACNVSRPNASNVNFVAATNVANFVITRTDSAGKACFSPSADTHLIWDQVAVVDLNVTTPRRLLDTRAA